MTLPLPTRLRCGFPESIANIANQAAYILDPDTGGDKTYTDNNTIEINSIKYYVADLPIWAITFGEYPLLDSLELTDYGQVMKTKNPEIWYNVLNTLAIERGRELNLDINDITLLCNTVLFDDELSLL